MNTPHHTAKQRTRIKVCGLTREQDVDAAVDAGADAIGFVLYAPSPRAVTVQRAVQLASRLPPFVTPVLLFVNESAQMVIHAQQQIPGSMMQFHGDETARYCQIASQNYTQPFIRVARIPTHPQTCDIDIVKYAQSYSQAKAILLDAHVEQYGGSGQVFNWSLIPPNANFHLVLSGGLTSANVTDGVLQVRPRCRSLTVDVSSGVEVKNPDGSTRKGLKDHQEIYRFVAAVRAADAQLEHHHHV